MGDNNDFLSDWANTGSTDAGVEENHETADGGGEDGLEAGLVDEEGTQVDNGEGGDADATSETTADDDHDENGQVPYAAMKAERAKRQAERERAEKAEARQKELESQIEALRNPAPRPAQPAETTGDESAQPPDFWTDPQGYVEHMTNQRIAQAVQQVQMQNHFRQIEDRQRAQHADFDEVSQLAHQAASRDPELARRILTAQDPGAELYAVGKQIKDFQEITSNPEAYRERMRQELLAELGGEQGSDNAQTEATPKRRTVDLSTRRNAKADTAAAPPDPFKALFPE